MLCITHIIGMELKQKYKTDKIGYELREMHVVVTVVTKDKNGTYLWMSEKLKTKAYNGFYDDVASYKNIFICLSFLEL